MTYEESTVMNFLEETPDAWYSRREVARKAVKRKIFQEDPNWAAVAISSLLTQGLIEENVAGTIKFKKKSYMI
jgi:hypothetical protein